MNRGETDKTWRHWNRRKFLKTAGSGSLFLLYRLFLPGCARPGNQTPAFVQISDSHTGSEKANRNLEIVLNDIFSRFPSGTIIIHTGDVSEHGWKEELLDFKRIISPGRHPYLCLMGNHDSRWTHSGRGVFRKLFQEKHFIYEFHDLVIAGIDSSILLEQYGYISPTEIAWLRERLTPIRNKPTILCLHHPPGFDQHFLGSEYELFRFLRDFNIPLILAGHVHSVHNFQVNDTWILTCGATLQPSSGYLYFLQEKNHLKIYKRIPDTEEETLINTIPLNPPARKKLALTFPIQLKKKELQIPEPDFSGQVSYLVNGNTVDFKTSNSFHHLPKTVLNPGLNEVQRVIQRGEQSKIFQWQYLRYDLEDEFCLWERDLPEGIQTRPAFSEKHLIVATSGGRLYWIDVHSSSIEHTLSLSKQALISSPVVEGNFLYQGTLDGYLYCLQINSGKLYWRIKLDGAILATPLLTESSIYFGTGAGKFFSLNKRTGEINYVYQAGNHIKATPAYDGERLYFGAWDGYFYCLQASRGQLIWKKRINSPHFSPATCNPAVYNNRLVFSSHDYKLHCLNKLNGETIWSYPPEGIEFDWKSPILERCKTSYSSPLLYQNLILMTSITGHLVGFDLQSGNMELNIPLQEAVFDSFPIIVKDTLITGTIAGNVLFIDLRENIIKRIYSTGNNYIFSPAAAHHDLIAIGNLQGKLCLFQI